jgi:hypothetical protein
LPKIHHVAFDAAACLLHFSSCKRMGSAKNLIPGFKAIITIFKQCIFQAAVPLAGVFHNVITSMALYASAVWLL